MRISDWSSDVCSSDLLGTVTALELAEPHSDYLSALGPTLLRFFLDRGVLLRPLGNTIYVMPPYCIDDADLDLVYGLITEVGDRFGRSEEHTSELQSLMRISYAVFCLDKK